MIFKQYTPSYPLSAYIQHMIYAKGTQPLPYLMELPDGKLNLMIELESETVNTMFTDADLTNQRTMKRGWISGANGKSIIYQNNNHSAILSIRFTVGGFYALTHIPMSEIIHPGLEIETILGNSFNRLYQLLINEHDIMQLFRHVETYFINYIADNSFEQSLAKFIDTNLGRPIDWLVQKSGYSQKQLIQTLKKQTGFTPKHLQRLRRFHMVINHIASCDTVENWVAVAYQFGYYDQAHFIKEFVQFTGMSPAVFLRTKRASEFNKTVTDIILF